MKKEIKDFTTFLFSVLEKLLHLTDQSIILTPVTGTSISKLIDHDHGQSSLSIRIYLY